MSFNDSRVSFQTITSEKRASNWQSVGEDPKGREILVNLDTNRGHYARRSDDKRHPLSRLESTSPPDDGSPRSPGDTRRYVDSNGFPVRHEPPYGRRRRDFSPATLPSDFDSRGSSPRSSQGSRFPLTREPPIVEERDGRHGDTGRNPSSRPSRSAPTHQSPPSSANDTSRDIVRLPDSGESVYHDKDVRSRPYQEADRGPGRPPTRSIRGMPEAMTELHDDRPHAEASRNRSDRSEDQVRPPTGSRVKGTEEGINLERRDTSAETRRSARASTQRSKLGPDYEDRDVIVVEHGDEIEVEYDKDIEIVVTEPTPKKRSPVNRPPDRSSRNASISTETRTYAIRNQRLEFSQHGRTNATQSGPARPPDYYDPRLAVDPYIETVGPTSRTRPSISPPETARSRGKADTRRKPAGSNASSSIGGDHEDRRYPQGQQDRHVERPPSSQSRHSTTSFPPPLPAESRQRSTLDSQRSTPLAGIAFSPPPSVLAWRDQSRADTPTRRQAVDHSRDGRLRAQEEEDDYHDRLAGDSPGRPGRGDGSTYTTDSRQLRAPLRDEASTQQPPPGDSHLQVPTRGPRGLSQASSRRDLRNRSLVPPRSGSPQPRDRLESRTGSPGHRDDFSSSGELLYDSHRQPALRSRRVDHGAARGDRHDEGRSADSRQERDRSLTPRPSSRNTAEPRPAAPSPPRHAKEPSRRMPPRDRSASSATSSVPSRGRHRRQGPLGH